MVGLGMADKGHILLIEDDEKIAELVMLFLADGGYRVTHTPLALEGLKLEMDGEFDLLLVDRRLPDMDGSDMIRIARDNGCLAPVLIITARIGEEDRIEGLDCGADDYICKPFSFPELLARVDANVRREKRSPRDHHKHQIYTVGPLIVDLAHWQVRLGNKRIDLTDAEIRILALLAERSPRPVDRWTIIEKLFGRNSETRDRTIDMHISNLRTKLGESANKPSLLHTVKGKGYRLCDLQD